MAPQILDSMIDNFPVLSNTQQHHEKRVKMPSKCAADKDELILADNPSRFCMFPIRYPQVWEMYKKAEASFWTAEEVNLSADSKHWEALSDNKRHFISHVLAFFAASNGIVLENLAVCFMKEIQIPEVRIVSINMDVLDLPCLSWNNELSTGNPSRSIAKPKALPN